MMNAEQAGVYERLIWLYNNGSFSRSEALAAAHWCGQPGDVLGQLTTAGLLVQTNTNLFVVVTPIQIRVLEELVQQFGGSQFTRDDAMTVALWTGGNAATVEQLVQRRRLIDQGNDVLQIAVEESLLAGDRDEIELEDQIEIHAEEGTDELRA